ncbi:hypothetical protein CR513_32214, partial [Mucuna pruriens]
MLVHDLDIVDNNAQNGENIIMLLRDGFDVLPNDDVEEEQEMSQNENPGDAPEPPPIQLKRSSRQRQSFTRYTSDEYVTLTNGEEPECYQEAIESEERQKPMSTPLATHYKTEFDT